jgi:uncharacterized membrane protein
MNLRPMLVVNGLLVLGMVTLSAWGWSIIPEGTRVPVHWGLDGTPDRLGEKSEILVWMPVIAAVITALLWLLPRFDPRRANIEASAKFWNAAAILSVGMLAYAHALLVINATGYKIDMTNALIPAMSLMFIVIGNYLGKTRSNWFGGVRTPWTMSSDYSWQKTHRWAGRMFVASGVVGLIAWPLAGGPAALVVLIAAILASSLVSVALSYVFWRADPERVANGTH